MNPMRRGVGATRHPLEVKSQVRILPARQKLFFMNEIINCRFEENCLPDHCADLIIADPRRTVAGLHPYLTRTVTSRNRRSFDCSTLKIFKNHSRRANSRAARLLLSPVGATMYSRAATRPSKVWAASSTVWNASTRTDKINDHGFIRIEARASLEESGRLFLVHVV